MTINTAKIMEVIENLQHSKEVLKRLEIEATYEKEKYFYFGCKIGISQAIDELTELLEENDAQ